jgi:hypothetical protein
MADDQEVEREPQLDLGITEAAWKAQLQNMRETYDNAVRLRDVRRAQLWDRIVDHILLKPESYGDRFRTRVRAAWLTTSEALSLVAEGDYAGALQHLKGLQLTLRSMGRNIPGCLPKDTE